MLKVSDPLCLREHLFANKNWDFDDGCQNDGQDDWRKNGAAGHENNGEGGELQVILSIVDYEESYDEVSWVKGDAQLRDETADPALEDPFQRGPVSEERGS